MKKFIVSLGILSILLTSSCESSIEQPQEANQQALINLSNADYTLQKAATSELNRGNRFKAELRELTTDRTNEVKLQKAEYLIRSVEEVDAITANLIKQIDDLKIKLLRDAGENIHKVGEEAIISQKYDVNNPLQPIHMKLLHVENKGYHDFAQDLLIGKDPKKPIGKGMDLFKSLLDYRKNLIELVAGSHLKVVPSGEKYSVEVDNSFSFKAPKIWSFKDQEDLENQFKRELDSSPVNLDDREVLTEIYLLLTKKELHEHNGEKGVHWLGTVFNQAPLVGIIAELTSMQRDILAARALAISSIRSRVSGSVYSFNKVMPLAYGPSFVRNGEEFEVQILMAAFDDEWEPQVTCNGKSLDELQNARVQNGIAIIRLKADDTQGSQELKGTIDLVNKAGISISREWQLQIPILK